MKRLKWVIPFLLMAPWARADTALTAYDTTGKYIQIRPPVVLNQTYKLIYPASPGTTGQTLAIQGISGSSITLQWATGGGVWGSISGTMSDQTDLQAVLTAIGVSTASLSASTSTLLSLSSATATYLMKSSATVTYCHADGTNCSVGVTPGGTGTQIQYNNGGSFGGVPGSSVTATGPTISSMTANLLTISTGTAFAMYAKYNGSDTNLWLGGTLTGAYFNTPFAVVGYDYNYVPTISQGGPIIGVGDGSNPLMADAPTAFLGQKLSGGWFGNPAGVLGLRRTAGGLDHEGFYAGGVGGDGDCFWQLPEFDAVGFWKSDGAKNLSISALTASDMAAILKTTSTWTAQQSFTSASPSTFTALADSGLTAGHCVQAGTGGLLTSAGAACGTGGGGASTLAVYNGVTQISSPTVAVAADGVSLTAYAIGSSSAGFKINPASGTLQGNTFNGNSQLVQTTAAGLLPALNGSLLTNLTAANISAGNLGSLVVASSIAANAVYPAAVSAGSYPNITGVGTLDHLNVTYNVNAGSTTGSGLSTCGSTSQAQSYNATTGLFGCTTITAAGIGALTGNQSISVTGDSSGSGATAITLTAAANQPNIKTLSASSTTITGNAEVDGWALYKGSASVLGAGGLGVTYNINVGSMTGAGLSSCNAAGNAVNFNSTSKQFGCATGYLTGNQSITLSGDASGTGTTAITVTNAANQPSIVTLSASSVTFSGASGLKVSNYEVVAGSLNVTGAGGITSTYGVSGASGTFSTTLSIPNGTNPTVSAAGQIGIDTNAGQLLMYDGTTAQVVASSTKSFTVTISSGNGWNGLTIPVWRAPVASSITITQILAESLGASTTVQYQLSISTYGSVNTLGASVFSVAYSTANNTGVSTTSFSNKIVKAQQTLVLTTPSSNAATGSPTMMTFTVYYLENKQ